MTAKSSSNCDPSPPQGPSRDTAGQVAVFFSLIRRGGAPSGAAALVAWRYGDDSPHLHDLFSKTAASYGHQIFSGKLLVASCQFQKKIDHAAEDLKKRSDRELRISEKERPGNFQKRSPSPLTTILQFTLCKKILTDPRS